MRSPKLVGAAMCSLALVAAACGSDDSGSSSTEATAAGTEAPAGSSAEPGTSGAAAEEFTLDEPLKIVGFWETKGESAVAVDDFENAAQMALDKINADGGVGGQPVEYERIANPVLDPQKASAAYLSALDADPSVIIGGGGSTQAISGQVKDGGVALISPDVNQSVEFGAPGGSDYMWLFSSDQSAGWRTATQYVVEELGAEKVGLMGYTIPFGSIAIEAAEAELAELGLEPYAVRDMPLPATDLTQQVLAMEGADAVLNASYQNDNALQLRQFEQNGIDIPSMFQGGLTIATAQKLVEGDVLSNAYAFSDCDTLDAAPDMTEFREAYEAEYGSTPTYLAAIAYDLVFYAAAAAEQAQSSDAQAINDAIPEVTYTDGICQPDYHADGAHVIIHQVKILKFNPDGTWEAVKTYDEPDKESGA